MRGSHMRVSLLISLLLCSCFAVAQDKPNEMSGMDMSHMSGNGQGTQEMSGMESGSNAEAMHSMEGHHMDMGPHMKMTEMRPVQPGDKEKAEQVAVAARAAAEKYKDYKVA